MHLVPIKEFNWSDNDMQLQEITCKNHPTARYLSKDPWQRSLHFIEAAEGFGVIEECPCPFGDLVVVTDADYASRPNIRERLAKEMDSMLSE